MKTALNFREAMKAEDFQVATELAKSELAGKRLQTIINGKVVRDMEITDVQISNYTNFDWRIDGIANGERDFRWVDASYFPALLACGYIIEQLGRNILYTSIR